MYACPSPPSRNDFTAAVVQSFRECSSDEIARITDGGCVLSGVV
jgi:hypothetical protein